MGIFNRSKNTAATVAAQGPDLAHLTGDYTIDAAHSKIGFAVRHPSALDLLFYGSC